MLDLHNNARISAACARTYRLTRERERKREEPRELRGILNPWTALQFDTISWPLSVTSMGNRRPRGITVGLTPALSATPFFFSLSRPVIHDGVFIRNFPTCKNTAIEMCENVGNRANGSSVRESVISKVNEYFREFRAKGI